MFRRLRRLLGERCEPVASVPVLLSFDREQIAHLWDRPRGLPHIRWPEANQWLADHAGTGTDTQLGRRSIMAAYLDELSKRLSHQRWQSENVESITPSDDAIGRRIMGIAERAYKVLRTDLRAIRDDVPIPPIAIIALEPQSSYLDFIDHYYPKSGSFASSGGIYLRRDNAFPVLSLNASIRWGCEAVVVHELTHHALQDAGLPLWVEEGFTQMMEERIAFHNQFAVDIHTRTRQQEYWSRIDIETFLNGTSFRSPHEDAQHLSYHLAQWVVRSQLVQRPEAFFRFARACKGNDARRQFQQVLGISMRELVLATIGIKG